MSQKYKKAVLFTCSVILWACVVHTLFILLVLRAIPGDGMFRDGWELVVFFPHAILIYFLPPNYPFDDGVVNNWKIVAKIIDAFPASVLYGAVIALVFKFIERMRKK